MSARLLAILCLVLIAVSAHAPRDNAADHVPSIVQGFTVSETYIDTPEQFQALYHSAGHKVRVDIRRPMGRHEAASLIAQRIHSMKSLYDPRLSPYPGDLSNEIMCPEPYLPTFGSRETPDVHIQFAQGLATKRLTFGACADDLIVYRGLIAWYWCSASQTVVQLEAMVPKAEPLATTILEDYLHALRCND